MKGTIKLQNSYWREAILKRELKERIDLFDEAVDFVWKQWGIKKIICFIVIV